jgi:hypothetical protein
MVRHRRAHHGRGGLTRDFDDRRSAAGAEACFARGYVQNKDHRLELAAIDRKNGEYYMASGHSAEPGGIGRLPERRDCSDSFGGGEHTSWQSVGAIWQICSPIIGMHRKTRNVASSSKT